MQQLDVYPAFDWANASFEEAEAEVRRWGDKLGNGVDVKIVSVVAGLNLLSISTTQSCEGHLDHGLAYPWVMFDRPVCPCYAAEWQARKDALGRDKLEFQQAAGRLHKAMGECLHRPAESLKLARLLAEFYAAPVEPLAYLTIEYAGIDFYQLIPVIEEGLKEGKSEILARCQAEMARFAAFLKARCEAREAVH